MMGRARGRTFVSQRRRQSARQSCVSSVSAFHLRQTAAARAMSASERLRKTLRATSGGSRLGRGGRGKDAGETEIGRWRRVALLVCVCVRVCVCEVR